MGMLNLLKRSESGAKLNVTQFDTNYELIETEVNLRIQEGDSRLTDARVPLDHSHEMVDVTGLVDALAAKASTASVTAIATDLSAIGEGPFVADNDPRLADERQIADSDLVLFTVTDGVATLAANTVGPTHLTDGDYGALTFAGTTFTIKADAIGPSHLADGDYGVIVFSGATFSFDGRVVGPSQMTDGDYGAFTFASGVAALDTGVVGLAQMADGDYGAFTKASSTFTLDNNVVSPAKLSNSDFGLFTSASGVTTINDLTTLADFFAGAANKPVTAKLINDAYKPRVVAPVSGAVGFDANDGLFVLITEGSDNLVHDNTPWDNLPLGLDLYVLVKAGASARTHTWSDPGTNLVLPSPASNAPYNAINCYKLFVYSWVPDFTTPTTKSKRMVRFAGYFA